MASVRLETYTDYAWPPPFGALYRRNGLTLCARARGRAGAVPDACGRERPGRCGAPVAGSFYAIFPHGLMVGLFAPVFLFAVLALAIGVRRFWRRQDRGPRQRCGAAARRLRDALRLKYLDGGHGEGCNESDDRFTPAAPALPPLHLLRVHAVLRRDVRRDAVPLPARLAGAVSADQPAQAARDRRRHRARRRHRRACSCSTCAAIRCSRTRRSGRWTAASSRCCS